MEHESLRTQIPKPDLVEGKASVFFGPKVAEPEAPDMPEPDSEPPCSYPEKAKERPDCAPQQPFCRTTSQKRLWDSTISAVESRVSRHDAGVCETSAIAPGSHALRFAWLALHGISSRCFRVRNGLVQSTAQGPLQALFSEWAEICSNCIRVRQLCAALGAANLTSQALGDVIRDLLNVLDARMSTALQRRCSFMQFWVELQPCLRELQEIFALLKPITLLRKLPKLLPGQLLDALVGFFRAQEVSLLPWQACSRTLKKGNTRTDLIPLWILQRSMQPFLQSLSMRVKGEASKSETLPDGRPPEVLQSVGSVLATLPQKLRILDSAIVASEESACHLSTEKYFGGSEREARAFLPEGELGPVAESGEEERPVMGLRVLVSAMGGSLPPQKSPASNHQLPRRRLPQVYQSQVAFPLPPPSRPDSSWSPW